jgi:hypothetical protein
MARSTVSFSGIAPLDGLETPVGVPAVEPTEYTHLARARSICRVVNLQPATFLLIARNPPCLNGTRVMFLLEGAALAARLKGYERIQASAWLWSKPKPRWDLHGWLAEEWREQRR